ncbi:replication enhancer protein [Ocimum mosaic virus]|uniref:Replication enhancer n=1 Tax=Ocimum mosaic virus TaxID=2664941 RepID=A0A5Q0TU31_9GEMI|nr:replication enhancer protein [Ocimum mosaic virus]QGA69869.1 replication enhancer protein [Ocimum mosaic virus]
MDSRTGENITAAQSMSGVYTSDVPNPLYFKILYHHSRPFQTGHDIIVVQVRFNHNLKKALGILKCFLTFKIFTRLQPQTSHFLRVFRYQFMKYVNQLGAISLNICIRSADHVLYNVMQGTIEVQEDHDIKFKIY